MVSQGAGAPGTIGADVAVSFADAGDGTTRVTYDADAVVGGMVGGVGQRMLSSVSRTDGGRVLRQRRRTSSAEPPRPSPRPCRRTGRGRGRAGRRRRLHARPPLRASSQDDFLPGVAVGAGLVARRCPGRRRSSVAADDRPHGRVVGPRDGGRGARARDLRARAARPAPRAHRRGQRGASTRSSPSTPSAPVPGRPRPTRRWPRVPSVGPLHGLPFAFKDTHAVAGWRTTYGSPLRADHVPERDELMVERVRRAGVVVIGRTNVPEFAAGSHTFNRVFGTTLNPSTSTRPPAVPAGARPPHSPPAWCRWPTAPTWAARCATRRRSATSWGCGPRSAGCRSGRSTTSGRRRRSPGRWRATSATSRCCSRCSPARTRAPRSPSRTRARSSRRPLPGPCWASGSP